MRSTAFFPILFGLAVASCAGSSSEPPTTAETSTSVATPTTDGVPDTDPPLTTPPATDQAAVTFESEPIDAGPLFGSAEAASDDAQDERCADDLDECARIDDSQDDVDTPDPFVPAAVDAPFCAKLDELSERPFPSDDFEALVVAQAWFAELRPTVTGAALADFDVLSDWLDAAVDARGQLSFDDTSDAVDEAGERLDDYVDRNCNGLDRGRSEPVEPTQTEPTQTEPTDPEDPPLPNGVTIPLISISGPVDDSPVPLFGSESASGGIADPEPGFVPQVSDAPFCTALDIINSRPQPSDDFEQLAFAGQYLVAIVPILPDDLVDEFTVLREWVEPIVISGSFDDADELDNADATGAAIETINEFVDTRCLGR